MPENERSLTKQLIIEAISRAISTNNCNAINGVLSVETEEEIRSLIPKLVVSIVRAYSLNEDLEKIKTSIINEYPDFTDFSDTYSLHEIGLDCSNFPKKKPLVEMDLDAYFKARILRENPQLNDQEVVGADQKSETMSQLVVATPGTSGENLRVFFSTQYSSSESASEEPEAKRMKIDAAGLDFLRNT